MHARSDMSSLAPWLPLSGTLKVQLGLWSLLQFDLRESRFQGIHHLREQPVAIFSQFLGIDFRARLLLLHLFSFFEPGGRWHVGENFKPTHLLCDREHP